MKVVDTILRYPCNSMTGRDGICRARVFASSSGIGLLLTDLGDLNTGQSVTNAIESVCRTAIENGLVDAGARLVEHYERSSGGSLDAVTFSAKGSPNWVNMDRREAMDLLGCSADEFDATTASNPRLMTLIQRIRNSIDPFMDGPHLESRDVILRRMDINERKISKASVAALVEAGSSERQLQALLKKERAESGAAIHNALIGPESPLQVDPDKDVNVRYVVIGGRTRDDVQESRMRNDYERSFNPTIKLESWDSWLRKLRRE